MKITVLDSAYYSLIDILRYVAFLGLVVISMILSVTFYLSAVEDLAGKIMLGFAAFALESVKIYTLIFAEYTWFSTKGKAALKRILRTFWPYALFLSLTFLSVIASVSFAQASIYSSIEQVQLVQSLDSVENPLIEIKNELLINKQRQLSVLNDKLDQLNPKYVTLALKLSGEVNTLNADIYMISEEILNIKHKAYEDKVQLSQDMRNKKDTFNRFYLLGKPIGLDETQTLFIFLVLFAVLLELGIISTAPAPDRLSIRELIKVRKPKKTQYKKKIVEVPKNAVIEPVVKEVTEPIREKSIRKLSSASLLNDLYEKGSNFLKEPDEKETQAKKEKYIKLLESLSLMRPVPGSKPLITKEGERYKMNYAFSYIKSILKDKK